jgi:hypothetical protein
VDIGSGTETLELKRHIPEMQLRNFCRMTFIDGSLHLPLMRLRRERDWFLPYRRGFHLNPATHGAADASERGGTSCAC